MLNKVPTLYLLYALLCICKTSSIEQDQKAAAESQKCQREFKGDCTEIADCSNGELPSGIYTIQPSTYLRPFYVYCDMDTAGGGWTVFQKRQDGTVMFFRDWDDYKQGFGNVNSEYWLGNEKLFYLTAQGNYKLRVDLSDFEGDTRFAEYSSFAIGDEANNYKLFLGSYSGNAGNSLAHHGGMYFTTKDRDNDLNMDRNCATRFKGAWWYNEICHTSNLNGLYLFGPHTSFANGVNWYGWHENYYSLKTTQMKVKRI